MMALVQEMGGRSLRVTRYKRKEYAPQASDAVSQKIIGFFRSIEPAATETEIVNMILDAQRKYRGKPMRFVEYFPGYGVTITPF